LPSTVKQRPLHAEGPDAKMETVTTNVDTGNVTKSSSVVPWSSTAYNRLWRGIQITESEEHPGWRKRLSARQDIGGNFRMRRKQLETKVESQFLATTGGSGSIESRRRYYGPVLAVPATSVTFPPYSQSANSTIESFGTTAIARCKPTNNVADLSVALGELYRERLPSIARWDQIKYETDKARRAGSEYLKSEFGWMPLLGELRGFINAVNHAGKLLDQYEKDSGKVVRRRYSFPPERTSTVTDLGTGNPAISISADWYQLGLSPEGKRNRERETYRRRWFSGAFTYHLPRGYKSSNAMARYAAKASYLYGAELTPATVWNLAPWSWAVDWFTNFGDVFSNVSDWATDGLVMRYGYIMEHSFIRDTYTYYGKTNLRTPAVPQPVTVVTETKVRRQANPFGFGVTWEGLTPRQIAITIALGLTKSGS
jgi:hypothetical protein